MGRGYLVEQKAIVTFTSLVEVVCHFEIKDLLWIKTRMIFAVFLF